MLHRLDAERQALLHRYDDKALHQLRVALRRLRSLLRHNASSAVHHIRHELGELADTTSAARDWDTLVIRARETLSPRKFRLVQPWLEERQAASHRPVLDMLRSGQWPDVMSDVKKWVKHNDPALVVYTQGDSELEQAKRRVYRAWCKVQSENDYSNWHKLRVAIKELRYGLENIPKDSRDPLASGTLKQCKQLQEYLGQWHDTIVHLRMVRDFADSLDPQADIKLLKVLRAWCDLMERVAQDYLDRARSGLEGKGLYHFIKTIS